MGIKKKSVYPVYVTAMVCYNNGKPVNRPKNMTSIRSVPKEESSQKRQNTMNMKSIDSLSVAEFGRRFATEKACEDYLIASRWPDGFRCPVSSCHDTHFYRLHTRRALKCKKNGHQTFLTAGTAMQGTRTPLRLWFRATHLLSKGETRISALQLQRGLRIKRYETAFNILHKLRASMINPFRDRIGGIVLLDESYIGGPVAGGKRIKGTKGARIVLAVKREEGTDGSIIGGEIRLRHIKDISNRSVISFIQDSIAKRSTITTDRRRHYGDLKGYTHQPETSLLLARSILSDLRTWIEQSFHGVSKKHLQAYLNEYAFMINKKVYSSQNLAKMKEGRRKELSQRKERIEEHLSFEAILGLCSKVRFPTYEGLYSGEWKHPKARYFRYRKSDKIQ